MGDFGRVNGLQQVQFHHQGDVVHAHIDDIRVEAAPQFGNGLVQFAEDRDLQLDLGVLFAEGLQEVVGDRLFVGIDHQRPGFDLVGSTFGLR